MVIFRELGNARHIAEPTTVLAEVCEVVSRLKPGQAVNIDRHTLSEIPGYWHNEARFTPAHQVLESIIGAAYTHSFSENPLTGDVTFYRHENTGQLRYSSPDDEYRREQFDLRRKHRVENAGKPKEAPDA